MAAEVRYEIVFVGRVQGVGFRYTTRRIASALNVAGWVRNEPDGSVRCVAEGSADQLQRLVEEIREAMNRNIDDVRIDRQEAAGSFDGFSIRY